MLDIYFDQYHSGNTIHLFLSEEEIEREFLRIVERDYSSVPAFWDDNSLQMMWDYDQAMRKGNYGIVTMEGEGCIHALSAECQAVLVIMHAAKNYRDVPLYINPVLIGIDTWIWLAEHYDFKMMISRTFLTEGIYSDVIDLLYDLQREINLKLEGEEFGAATQEGYFKLSSYIDAQKDWYYGLEQEAEAKAFDSYKKIEGREIVLCSPKECLDMESFFTHFEKNTMKTTEKCGSMPNLQIINTCSTFYHEWKENSLLLYLLLRKDEVWDLSLTLVQNASIPICIRDEIWIKHHESYDEVYALLKPAPKEGDYTTGIYDRNLIGIHIDLKHEKMELHHKDLAVCTYHKLQKEARRIGRVNL